MKTRKWLAGELTTKSQKKRTKKLKRKHKDIEEAPKFEKMTEKFSDRWNDYRNSLNYRRFTKIIYKFENRPFSEFYSYLRNTVSPKYYEAELKSSMDWMIENNSYWAWGSRVEYRLDENRIIRKHKIERPKYNRKENVYVNGKYVPRKDFEIDGKTIYKVDGIHYWPIFRERSHSFIKKEEKSLVYKDCWLGDCPTKRPEHYYTWAATEYVDALKHLTKKELKQYGLTNEPCIDEY